MAANNQKPVANAGVGQTVGLSTLVSLDGSQSSDSDGVLNKFQWRQIKGPKVNLRGAKTASPSFTSPATLHKKAVLAFRLTVTDDRKATANATVSVVVTTCRLPKVMQNGRCEAFYSAQKVFAGSMHNCALLIDNSVKCWGWNEKGQLGLGDTLNRGHNPSEMGDNLPRVDMGDNLPHFTFIGIRTAKTLAAAAFHTCAILDDDTVRCWGDNDAGRLGIGDQANRGDNPDEMGGLLPRVDLGSGRTAKALAAGIFHTCALLDDNSVKCWGLNYAGRLGIVEIEARGDEADEMGDNLPSVDLGVGRTAKALAAGYSHTCAILDDNSVKCWGENAAGSLGIGDTVSRGGNAADMGDNLPRVDLGSGRTAKSIAAGGYHTCALLDDNSVKCWGSNDSGQLGLGNRKPKLGAKPNEMGDQLPRVNLGKGRKAKALAAGSYHSCALLDNNSVKCWGSGGVLGLGDSMNRGFNTNEMGDKLPTVKLGTGRTAVGLAAGENHSCVVLDDNTVKCWGWNGMSSGVLGLGNANSKGDKPGDMGDHLPIVDLGN